MGVLFPAQILARAQGDDEMSYGYKCASCSRKDTEICEQCLGDQYAPIAKPAQSADDLDYYETIFKITKNNQDMTNKLIDYLEADRAAQRQAGREEMLATVTESLDSSYTKGVADTDARYAALVEAVRRRVDPTARCDECLLTELTKALRDLEGK